jgi:ferritin-like metal-binding protein YciE
MNLKSLHDVYVHELKDLYSAEKQITEALPQMAEAASDKATNKKLTKLAEGGSLSAGLNEKAQR